jgi:hypothetical protein
MNDLGTHDIWLEFYSDAAEFVAAAGEYLAVDPVVGTVVRGVAHRALAQLSDGIVQPEHNWWLTVSSDADSWATGRRAGGTDSRVHQLAATATAVPHRRPLSGDRTPRSADGGSGLKRQFANRGGQLRQEVPVDLDAEARPGRDAHMPVL